MDKIALYFHTVRFLRIKQVYYRLYYLFVYKFFSKKLKLTQGLNRPFIFLNYQSPPQCKPSFKGNTFTFLNLSHTFKDGIIDWEWMNYGKLWQYNLCYFDFLNQPTLSKQEGIDLIKHFIQNQKNLKSGIEPYPTSLRVINWIKFVSKYQINDLEITDAIYVQANHVSKRLEYHLLGNHLLENAFCLLHAGYFFKEKKFINLSIKILKNELDEQVLEDGGQFELSPMYHQIILFRVLEAIDLVRNNNHLTPDPSPAERGVKAPLNTPLSAGEGSGVRWSLEQKASKMLAWLNNITFPNGEIPLSNDSAFGIAPSTFELQNLAKSLNIQEKEIPLSTSGYRKYANQNFELIIDVGQISPDYQPGHAHADALNVVIYANSKPFIVDTGTSTYEKNERRQLERSTQSHNTVTFDNENQSQVWGGFRVGKRAKVDILNETKNSILAQHDGYRKFGVIHQRQLDISESQIIIEDMILGTNKTAIAHFHFHPEINFKIIGNILETDNCQIIFSNFEKIVVEEYLFAPQFNTLIPSRKVLIEFRHSLITTITTIN